MKKMNSIRKHLESQNFDPEICHPYRTLNHKDRYQCLDQAVASFEKGKTIKFLDVITREEWQYFCEHTTAVGRVLINMMPAIWQVPSRIKVIEHFLFFDYLDELVDYSKTAVQFHRQITDQQTRCFCAVGGGDYDRANLVQSLYALGFDQDMALYHTASEQTHSQSDPWQLNPDLHSLPPRQLEPYHRWDFMANVAVLSSHVKQTDLELVVPNRFPHDPNQITEKDLLSVVTGVPAYRMYSASLRSIWQELGMRYTGTTTDRPTAETLEWLSLYHRLSRSQRQRWQDQQGPEVAHNHRQFQKWPALMYDRYLESVRRS